MCKSRVQKAWGCKPCATTSNKSSVHHSRPTANYSFPHPRMVRQHCGTRTHGPSRMCWSNTQTLSHGPGSTPPLTLQSLLHTTTAWYYGRLPLVKYYSAWNCLAVCNRLSSRTTTSTSLRHASQGAQCNWPHSTRTRNTSYKTRPRPWPRHASAPTANTS